MDMNNGNLTDPVFTGLVMGIFIYKLILKVE